MPSNQYRPLTRAHARGPSPPRNTVGTINRGLTLFCAAYLAFAILSSLAPASSLNARSKTAASLACNPFALPGFISQLPSGLSTFRTFDQSCPVPGLLPTLLSLLPTSPYHALAVAPTDSHSRSDVTDRIANKTVLMIGDTVDEALVNHFCTLIGRTTEVVDQRHPWGVAWTLVPEAHRTSSSNNIISSDPGDKALAHYCYMPEYDFLLTSVYHLGTDVDDTFRKSPGFTAPTLFELRVEDIYSRYMKDLASAHPAAPSIPPSRRHSYPDLTILSSTFWDLARFAQEDSLQMRSLVEDVSEHRLLMWRGRSVDMLHSIQSAWKDTKLGWRSLHAPGDTEKATLEWYTGTQEEGSNTMTAHPLFHLNRIVQLNAARQSVLSPTGDDVVKGVKNRSSRLPKNVADFDWGNVLLGQDHHQGHPINPSLDPGGSIFAEMLLNAL